MEFKVGLNVDPLLFIGVCSSLSTLGTINKVSNEHTHTHTHAQCHYSGHECGPLLWFLHNRNISSNMVANLSRGQAVAGCFCSLLLPERRWACAVYSEEPLAALQPRKSQLFMKPRLTKDSKASNIQCVSPPHFEHGGQFAAVNSN